MGLNELITTEEAAKILWVSSYTIREYIKQKKLKAKKIGKRYLIDKSDVESLLSDLV